MKMQKSLLTIIGVTVIILIGCTKTNDLVSPSARATSDSQPLQSSSQPTPVTFVLVRGALSVSGAIQTSGTYTMNPVKQTGMAFHCTNNLTTPDGTITALTNCYDNSTGTWRIISGTGAYANLRGNGTLVMYPEGETWTGKIF